MSKLEEWTNKVICGDCLELMKELPDGCVDLMFADPPYGEDKAIWDKTPITGFESEGLRVAHIISITPGIMNLHHTILKLGSSYRGIISARILNGMTRGPLGFGNWIPVVIGGSKIPIGQDAFDFVIDDKKVNHPSPKPLRFMRWIVERFTKKNDLILDPFMGSGTTAVACKQLGRRFIGFEINPEYVKICNERLKQEELFNS